MADTKEFTEAKSKAVTSATKVSRQTSPAPLSMNAGISPVTSGSVGYQKEAEKIRDTLAIAKDLMNQWPCRMPNGEMPKPYLANKYGMLIIALPNGGHVIDNIVTSDGRHDFSVDGIAVTSEEKVTDA